MKWPQGCGYLCGLSTMPVARGWETACVCLSAAARGEEDGSWRLLFPLLSLGERLWVCFQNLEFVAVLKESIYQEAPV